jgi:hypothetical protein
VSGLITSNVIERLHSEIAPAVKTAMQKVFNEVVDSSVQQYLDDSSCWLDFDTGRLTVLLGIGEEPTSRFVPEIETDPYPNGPLSQEQQDDVLARIAGMKTFIAELQAACLMLEAQAKAFEEKTP